MNTKECPSSPLEGLVSQQLDVRTHNEDAPIADLLEQLERAYMPPPIPKCRICGADLSIGAIGGGEPTRYYCSVMSGAPHNGAKMDWDHFGESLWLDRSQGGDLRVIELTRRMRALLANAVLSGPAPGTK